MADAVSSVETRMEVTNVTASHHLQYRLMTDHVLMLMNVIKAPRDAVISVRMMLADTLASVHLVLSWAMIDIPVRMKMNVQQAKLSVLINA